LHRDEKLIGGKLNGEIVFRKLPKHLTFPIEQDNSNIRHFLARFRLRTKVVSKTEEMVDLSLRLYHHLHDQPAAFAALSMTFLSIFG
jgi:insertion element IS1 protein InsB